MKIVKQLNKKHLSFCFKAGSKPKVVLNTEVLIKNENYICKPKQEIRLGFATPKLWS